MTTRRTRERARQTRRMNDNGVYHSHDGFTGCDMVSPGATLLTALRSRGVALHSPLLWATSGLVPASLASRAGLGETGRVR